MDDKTENQKLSRQAIEILLRQRIIDGIDALITLCRIPNNNQPEGEEQ